MREIDINLPDCERYVEAAYREVDGIYQPGWNVSEIGGTSYGRMDNTQRGANRGGNLAAIRERLRGSFDLSVLEVRYNTRQDGATLIHHISVVSDRLEADAGIRKDLARNYVMGWSRRADVVLSVWAEITGLKLKTLKDYRSRANSQLENWRKSAVMAAYH